jgi:hypothetical protein
MPGSKSYKPALSSYPANKLLDSLLLREAKRRFPSTESDSTMLYHVIHGRGIGGSVNCELLIVFGGFA